MENAAVDEPSGNLLGFLFAVSVNEEPASAWHVLVRSRDGVVPVLHYAMEGAFDALAASEPVDGAEDVAETDEQIGSHNEWRLLIGGLMLFFLF